MTMLAKQTDWALRQGFRLDHDTEEETVFRAYFDGPDGLVGDETYRRRGWAARHGQGRMLPRLSVARQGVKWTVSYMHPHGRGKLHTFTTGRDAWTWALDKAAKWTKGGMVNVTAQIPEEL